MKQVNTTPQEVLCSVSLDLYRLVGLDAESEVAILRDGLEKLSKGGVVTPAELDAYTSAVQAEHDAAERGETARNDLSPLPGLETQLDLIRSLKAVSAEETAQYLADYWGIIEIQTA